MSPNTIRTVNQLKDALSKELSKDENDHERCIDMISQLDAIEDVTLQVLSETLVGTVVSKFKSHDDATVSAKAKSLVKKWKQIAKHGGLGKAAKATVPTKTKPTQKPKYVPKTPAPTAAATPAAPTEWDHLPPLRKNTATKLHQTFSLSTSSLLKSGIHNDAISSLTTSRSTEVEIACHEFSKGQKQNYLEKIRSLIFNLKKNSDLRETVILGSVPAETLITLPPEQLATAEKRKELNETVAKLKDSRRLDWEQANEGRINEMCGIKGDLLKASLFTCGRCKSIKTTSTQKQTRSADEPMTVFVLCLNCGNRWKC